MLFIRWAIIGVVCVVSESVMAREWNEGDIGDEKAVGSEDRHRYSFIDRSTHTGGWWTIGSALIHGHPARHGYSSPCRLSIPRPDSDERILNEAPWAHRRGEAINSERP